jgi:hypothetical protein
MMMIVKHRKRKVMERRERNEMKVVMKMMKYKPSHPITTRLLPDRATQLRGAFTEAQYRYIGQ